MKSFRTLIGLLLVIGTSLAAGRTLSGRSEQAASAAGTSSQVSTGTFPKDVYANTGNRLPAVKRDDLDDAGKKFFDSRAQADSFGPGGLRLYSLPVAEDMGEVNDFLRHKSGLDPRLVELAILVTAREQDCEYVWTAHEPQGLKAGLQQQTIERREIPQIHGGTCGERCGHHHSRPRGDRQTSCEFRHRRPRAEPVRQSGARQYCFPDRRLRVYRNFAEYFRPARAPNR